MRKKITNLSAGTLFDTVFPRSLALVIGLTFIYIGCEQARGETRETPGLPIARLALPSILPNKNVVSPTGTLVGEKVIELGMMIQEAEGRANSIIESLREGYEKAIIEVNQYHLIVSEIEAKLQLGTTPSNPRLVEMGNYALQQLDEISDTISMLDGLAAGFSKSSEHILVLSAQIEDALHAPGAVDEDHAHLILMSDELSAVNEVISQSLDILNANTVRQSQWLSAERIHLANLSAAIDKGKLSVTSHGSVPQYPLPVVLPELPSPLIDPPKKKQDLSQIKSKKLQDKLISEAPPFAPIHQEVLEEIAQSSKHETALAAPVSETHENKHREIIRETPPLASAALVPSAPAHEDIYQEVAHEAPPSAPVSLVPVPQTHEDIHQEVAHEAPPLAPLPVAQNTHAQHEKVPQISTVEAIPAKSVIPPSPQPPIEQPLPLISVAAHPKVQPLSEEIVAHSEEETTPLPSQEQSKPSETLISFSTAAKERPPLAHLGSNQEVWSQKWVLVSSAKRGLKSSPNGLEIVNVVGEKGPSDRGEKVKSLLIKMGLRPEQLHVINAKGEENQAGQVYIFGGQ
ncbi:MAG: hypothetical protein BGO67_06850 [Alphaproteobacteria bacterium 41-28]|nr:MAG: hypothetical protein BGO67_06850 [Alphaproteobacteria bacterium 41-28]